MSYSQHRAAPTIQSPQKKRMPVSTNKTRTLNIMLIGCGPHTKQVYLPALQKLSAKYDLKLCVVVELETEAATTRAAINERFQQVDFVFTPPLTQPHHLPMSLRNRLDAVADRHAIDAVIVATEPLSHMQYALWACTRQLHILMDAPISTRPQIANSTREAATLVHDFKRLQAQRDPTKAFIVNVQRRYHSGFEQVSRQVTQVAKQYGAPITSMQSMHCDGQWRLPAEIITQAYHPFIGYGKISHNGYHLVDVVGRLVRDSFAAADKSFDRLGVYSSFVRPTGLLYQQNRNDYLRVFGEQYEEVNRQSDVQLAEAYDYLGGAEVDSSSMITLFKRGNPLANISLNLMHNGFARRHWLQPGKDLYKGNGQVGHEYHNIQQGPYQNIQVHSYQANDQQAVSTVDDYDLGGNNHFDIYIFRNTGIIGGNPLQIIRSQDIAKQAGHSSQISFAEHSRHRVIEEFVEIASGMRQPADTASDLASHEFGVQLMSLMYRSGIKRKEITAPHMDGR